MKIKWLNQLGKHIVTVNKFHEKTKTNHEWTWYYCIVLLISVSKADYSLFMGFKDFIN